jgi:hypothetical protein
LVLVASGASDLARKVPSSSASMYLTVSSMSLVYRWFGSVVFVENSLDLGTTERWATVHIAQFPPHCALEMTILGKYYYHWNFEITLKSIPDPEVVFRHTIRNCMNVGKMH